MRTLTVNELRTALKTAPHTKDGSGLPTRDQLKTALALARHSQAHRKAAEVWYCVANGTPLAVDVLATVCQAGVEPEDSKALTAWQNRHGGWEEAVFVARELHWAEACRLNELAHEQLKTDQARLAQAHLDLAKVWRAVLGGKLGAGALQAALCTGAARGASCEPLDSKASAAFFGGKEGWERLALKAALAHEQLK